MSNSKKPPILHEQKTSIFFLFPSFAILLISIIYLISKFEINMLLILLVINIFVFIPNFIQWKNKKIFITPGKIYVYNGKTKVIGWSFIEDFKLITINQTKYGKFLNYGTLKIVNQKNESYDFEFLDNPKKMFDEIIKRYEKNMKKINPDFVSTYKNDEVKLDKIED